MTGPDFKTSNPFSEQKTFACIFGFDVYILNSFFMAGAFILSDTGSDHGRPHEQTDDGLALIRKERKNIESVL